MDQNQRYMQLRSELDTQSLLAQAREKSSLSEFGDESFVIPLGKLLDGVAQEVGFHAQGLAEFKNEIIRILVNRLRFQNDLKQHPEILDEDVSDPIIILGLPRSGTTKTQRMIATDPSLLKTYLWQLINSAPFQNTAPGKPDPRIAAAAIGDAMVDGPTELNPVHDFGVRQVDEDIFLFGFTLNDFYVNYRASSFSYAAWVMSRTEPSDLDNYRYVRSLFQYLQWQQGGRQNRRWVMKNTGHTAHMDALINTYPNATLLHVHRHPREFMPSLAKMMFMIRSLREENLDPKRVCEHLFKWASIASDRYLETRDRLQLDGRIIDVQYEQIRTNPMPVIREVYRRAGHALTPEAERGMLQWEKENEQGKHGRHAYSLDEFGLSESTIDEAFGKYIKRFLA